MTSISPTNPSVGAQQSFGNTNLSRQTLSFTKLGRTIPAIIIPIIVMLASLRWFSSSEVSSRSSLVVGTVGGVVGIVLLHIFYLRTVVGPNALSVALATFLGKVALGTWHYLRFLDPSYLDGGVHSDYKYLWDFQWMHESLSLVAVSWQQLGFMSALPPTFWAENKNAYLTVYESLLYYFGGIHPLNIAAWNSLHSVLTATILRPWPRI